MICVIEVKKTLRTFEFSKAENNKKKRKIREAAHLLRDLCKSNNVPNIPYLVFAFQVDGIKNWQGCLNWHTDPYLTHFERDLRSDTLEAICVFNEGVIVRHPHEKTDEPLPLSRYHPSLSSSFFHFMTNNRNLEQYETQKRPQSPPAKHKEYWDKQIPKSSPCRLSTSWITLSDFISPIALLFAVIHEKEEILLSALD